MINIFSGLLFAFLVYLTYLFVIIKNPRRLKKFIFEGRETLFPIKPMRFLPIEYFERINFNFNFLIKFIFFLLSNY